MKKLFLFCSIAISTFIGASCEAPATNSAANANANAVAANANAAKPASAAPSMEVLFDMDKKANEAWIKNDTAYFEGMLSDKFVSFREGQRTDKASEIAMLKGVKCDVKTWNLEDPQMLKIDNDTYVVTYKANYDGNCTWEGRTEKIPSPARAASVWLRDGDKWKGVYHNEVPILNPAKVVDPKNPPLPPSREVMKGEPKKEEAAPAKPASGPNTDMLVKMHQAGWEAFKVRDAKWFNEHLAANFGLINPMGDYIGSKADTIKMWTEAMKCTDVNEVKVTDGVATSVSPTVEILTLRGSADGECDGQPNGDLWQTAIYVKEGDAWKLAFMLETPSV